MGICSSCLGRRRHDDYDEVSGRLDDERLLLDDPSTLAGYGGFDHHMAPENVETQREMESLQRVVARTAESMVDIFEVAPRDPMHMHHPPPFAYAGQHARIARYQHLAARLSVGDALSAAPNHPAAGPMPGLSAVDWISTDDEDDYDYVVMDSDGVEAQKHPLTLPDRPLVGTFADAAAAMGRDA